MKGKTTGLKQKGFAVVLSVFMAFLMMFTGCNQIAGVLEEKPGEEEEESSVETSEEPVSEEEKEKDGLGKTFASKVVGNYKCEISHDEVALLSLFRCRSYGGRRNRPRKQYLFLLCSRNNADTGGRDIKFFIRNNRSRIYGIFRHVQFDKILGQTETRNDFFNG